MMGLPPESVVIGIREDPLNAYADALARFFPHGVPISEAGFALHVLRGRKIDEMLYDDKRFVPPRPPGAPSDIPSPAEAAAPIRTIAVHATPVSSHGKTDWDALAVDVQAFDHIGRVVPVRGTALLTLWGLVRQPTRTRLFEPFVADPTRVRRLATWTRTISTFGADSRFMVPLPSPTPEHRPGVFPLGELHLRLLIPGSGTFETTQRDVLLSHRSTLRDRLREETGSRFFAVEGTSDRRRTSFRLLRDQTFWRPGNPILPSNSRVFALPSVK